MSAATYVAIRTHRVGKSEMRLLNRLRAVFPPERIVFAVDETQGPVVPPTGYRKVSVNRAFLQQEGLYADHPRTGWLCGDYFLYALLRGVPEAGRFWLIEPDVHFGTDALAALLQATETRPDDLLGCRFGKADPAWAWYRHGQLVGEVPHKCLFPLVRVSRRAVEQLLAGRRSLHARLRPRPDIDVMWPDDESFVATSLANAAGFVCADLAAVTPLDFSRFTAIQLVPQAFADSASPLAVMHPVLPDEELLLRLKARVRASLGASELQTVLHTLAPTLPPDLKPAVDVAMQEAIRTWVGRALDILPVSDRQAPPAPPAVAAQPEPAAPSPASTPASAPAVPGPVFPVRSTVPPKLPALARVTDFESLPGTERPPRRLVLAPYQVDPDTREVLLAETPLRAWRAASLSRAQRRLAGWAQRVPIEACDPGSPGDVASTFLFSMDSADAGLLRAIALGGDLPVVPEADIFSGIGWLGDADRDRVFSFAVHSLASQASIPLHQAVFRFRSDASPLATRSVDLFPRARICMLVRQVESWARSLIGTAKWTEERLLQSLMATSSALQACTEAGGRVTVIHYEDMLARPDEVLRTLFPGLDFDAQALERARALATEALQQAPDSRVAPDEVDRRVRAFLDRWEASKERAGLPL